MKSILVTGGCGYIGNNMVKTLVNNNYSVIVVDSLINSSEDALIDGVKFYAIDIRDKVKMEQVFVENKIDIVMDFAALLDVEESWDIPLEYHDVNVNGLNVILELMDKYQVKNIFFSSTAAVYKTTSDLLTEESEISPTNPYGMSKYSAEKCLEYFATNKNIKYIIFRYFNVVGSSKVGYDWDQFSTVVPKILASLKSGNEFVINGLDYNTIDGSPVRDYIHMDDLIEAHQQSVDQLEEMESGVYNLSIGNGTSVIQLFRAITDKFNIQKDYTAAGRRLGDIECSIASNDKIMNVVDWKIKYTNIDDIISKIKDENNY